MGNEQIPQKVLWVVGSIRFRAGNAPQSRITATVGVDRSTATAVPICCSMMAVPVRTLLDFIPHHPLP